MQLMKRLIFLLLFAPSLYGQSITTNLVDQTLLVGQNASFTFTVSNGPCVDGAYHGSAPDVDVNLQ